MSVFRLALAGHGATFFSRVGQVARVSSVTYTSVATVLSDASLFVGRRVTIGGWIKAARKQKNVSFIDIGDGSCSDRLQVIATGEGCMGADSPQLRYHSCVKVEGTVVESSHKSKQEVELIADRIVVVAACQDSFPSGESYPFRPREKYQPEYIRQFPMFRAKLNDFAALLRVRNGVSQSIHRHLQDEGFIQIQTPILTDNDCEGAGETFVVRPKDNFIISKSGKSTDTGEEASVGTAGGKEYFSKPVFLTVSGQLHLEAVCNGLGKVYNFSPVFRAERGRTRRHLSEFTMVEAEEAFVTTTDVLAERIERLLKEVIRSTLDTNFQDLEIYTQLSSKRSKLDELSGLLDSNFAILGYHEAFEAVTVNSDKFQKRPVYGELGTEHELYLAENYCGGKPVFVVDWPASSKPFYAATDGDGIAKALDLILPSVGEVAGGSVREHRTHALDERLQSKRTNGGGDNHPTLQWYSDLRHAGSAPTAGFGLGFERLVQFMLGVNNIRDALPFPRSPHQCLL